MNISQMLRKAILLLRRKNNLHLILVLLPLLPTSAYGNYVSVRKEGLHDQFLRLTSDQPEFRDLT